MSSSLSIATIPDILPVGITKFFKGNVFIGYRARIRSGAGKSNDKCFSNSKFTLLELYNQAYKWLETAKNLKKSRPVGETGSLNLEKTKKQSGDVYGVYINSKIGVRCICPKGLIILLI